MNKRELYEFKSKCILMVSVILILVSVVLTSNSVISIENFELTTINIKEMATASVALKTGEVTDKKKKLIEVTETEVAKEEQQEAEVRNLATTTRTWYLPTEYGTITQYPSYYHVAYDITSPRGSNEVIYPVAAGVISSIYTDNAGALIVTVRHNIDGLIFTSQYVHLSRYADIYVGQEVTPFTPLGWMGTTGWSTGVHLHLALMDCNLFGGTDMCSDLGGWINYQKIRYQQGFTGLGNAIDVPYQWYSR